MPTRVGLDTSFVLGLIDDQDLWHDRALNLQSGLDRGDFHIHIFDCVLAEVISLLARRTQEKRRTASFADLAVRLRVRFPTRAITWLYPELPSAYDDVFATVTQSAGELNFNDALIALSCQKRSIPWLVSFDADFDRVPWLRRVSRADELLA
jgi:predicted nucleic acid-binding protein